MDSLTNNAVGSRLYLVYYERPCVYDRSSNNYCLRRKALDQIAHSEADEAGGFFQSIDSIHVARLSKQDEFAESHFPC